MIGKAALLVGIALGAMVSLTGTATLAAGNVIKEQKTAGPYKLVLQIGPAEVEKAMADGMEMGEKATCHMPVKGHHSAGVNTCNRHVEVHVYRAKDGSIVHVAKVTMTFRNVRTHKVTPVPVMSMMGSEGSSDFHFGNNIALPAGTYILTVNVNHIGAAFPARLT